MGEAVVVIKKLIQLQPKEHKDLIVHVAKLVDSVTVSNTVISCRQLTTWVIPTGTDGSCQYPMAHRRVLSSDS